MLPRVPPCQVSVGCASPCQKLRRNKILMGFDLLCYSCSILLSCKYAVAPTQMYLLHAKKGTFLECSCSEVERESAEINFFVFFSQGASPPQHQRRRGWGPHRKQSAVGPRPSQRRLAEGTTHTPPPHPQQDRILVACGLPYFFFLPSLKSWIHQLVINRLNLLGLSPNILYSLARSVFESQFRIPNALFIFYERHLPSGVRSGKTD